MRRTFLWGPRLRGRLTGIAMDSEKFKVLKGIGYVVKETCSTCIHANIRAGAMFGTCEKHSYDHQKHSGPPRQLSINRSGWCPDYVPSATRETELHRFSEFLER